MKKKVASKRTASKVKKTAPASRKRSSVSPVISYQRIVIIASCLVLAFVGVGFFNKPAIQQSVAGVSVARGLFAQATVSIPEVDGAVKYNIYFKKASENTFTNAVRDIPVGTASYTISYLTKGQDYDHKIVAVDATGKEFWFTPSRPLLNIEGM